MSLPDACQARSGVRSSAPRVLSDNGPCCVSAGLRRLVESQGIEKTPGAPCYPLTQGKLEHDRRVMKNRVHLQAFHYVWDLEQEIARCVGPATAAGTMSH